jgi:hypothetical protein
MENVVITSITDLRCLCFAVTYFVIETHLSRFLAANALRLGQWSTALGCRPGQWKYPDILPILSSRFKSFLIITSFDCLPVGAAFKSITGARFDRLNCGQTRSTFAATPLGSSIGSSVRTFWRYNTGFDSCAVIVETIRRCEMEPSTGSYKSLPIASWSCLVRYFSKYAMPPFWAFTQAAVSSERSSSSQR